MVGAIASFVKTPGLSDIKTRLAKDVGKQRAEEIYLDMVNTTENVLLSLDDSLKPYWAVGEDSGLSKSLWNKFEALYTGEGTLGERLHNVYSILLAKHDYVILIGSDCPDISPDHINCAAEISKDGRFVFGPTFDGGFYLFAGNKKVPKEVWTSVEYSKDDTMQKLSNKIEKLGDVLAIEALSDVDTVEDLSTMDL